MLWGLGRDDKSSRNLFLHFYSNFGKKNGGKDFYFPKRYSFSNAKNIKEKEYMGEK
jgi:Mor family transcriptional regulator